MHKFYDPRLRQMFNHYVKKGEYRWWIWRRLKIFHTRTYLNYWWKFIQHVHDISVPWEGNIINEHTLHTWFLHDERLVYANLIDALYGEPLKKIWNSKPIDTVRSIKYTHRYSAQWKKRKKRKRNFYPIKSCLHVKTSHQIFSPN